MSRDSFSCDFTRTFDVLIVGAGATGALVALRMAEQGVTVAVLEAGPRFSGHLALQNSECGNASAFPDLRRRAAATRTLINPRADSSQSYSW